MARNASKTKVELGSPTKIATSIVEQGPRDDLTRVDGLARQKVPPMATTVNQTLNKYMDDFYKDYKGLVASLNLPSLDLSKAKIPGLEGIEGIKNTISNLTKEANAIKSRIENNVLGGRKLESLRDLKDGFKKDALGSLTKMLGGTKIAGLDIGHLVNTGMTSYKDAVGIYNIVKSGDWSSLSGIQQALGALGKNSLIDKFIKPIIDISAIGAFVGKVVSDISRLGIPGLIKEVKALFRSPKEGNRNLVHASHNAAIRGDLDMLEEIVDTLGVDGSGMINSQYRLTVENILRSFHFTPLYNPSKIGQYREKLLRVLNKIDPHWWYDDINGEKCYRLGIFRVASKDAVTLLNFEDKSSYLKSDVRDVLLIAKSYSTQDVKTLALSQYSQLVFRNKRRS